MPSQKGNGKKPDYANPVLLEQNCLIPEDGIIYLWTHLSSPGGGGETATASVWIDDVRFSVQADCWGFDSLMLPVAKGVYIVRQ